ncbi:MAG: chemotaxis protein [Gammaproteobacteria bacterium HGW-Gammaproteobacteria-2]|nr:MAG: chemotaxis protein [Gammaproteobacteria bacterium HGW-Gammaproteobacteria-2]
MNLPVTDTEHHLRDGDSVVSRTDIRGIITYVNTTFCEISGYSREELIGRPHNIMRHPDMPAAVFADLWATLKAGKAWKGLIKNRCKDGGFYWVEANANPIIADDEVVGYMSLRTRPTAEQVRRAQRAYSDLRDASRHHRWRLRRGRCVRSGWSGCTERTWCPHSNWA